MNTDIIECTVAGVAATIAAAFAVAGGILLLDLAQWTPAFLADFNTDMVFLFRATFLCSPFVVGAFIRDDRRVKG